MIIKFKEQLLNVLLIGSVKKCNGYDKEKHKPVYCIAVFSGNMQLMYEFGFDTEEERDKAYKKLSKKILRASAAMVRKDILY